MTYESFLESVYMCSILFFIFYSIYGGLKLAYNLPYLFSISISLWFQGTVNWIFNNSMAFVYVTLFFFFSSADKGLIDLSALTWGLLFLIFRSSNEVISRLRGVTDQILNNAQTEQPETANVANDYDDFASTNNNSGEYGFNQSRWKNAGSSKATKQPYGFDKMKPEHMKYWNVIHDPNAPEPEKRIAFNAIMRDLKKENGGAGKDIFTN